LISIVISTINENINNLKGTQIPGNIKYLVVHQIFKEKLIIKKDKKLLENPFLKIVSFQEKGLSKSRNRGIENVDKETDYVILTDDDVSFVENLEQIITAGFRDNPDADIITFQSLTPDGRKKRKYKNKAFWHSKRTVKNVSSIEIVIKYSSIRNKNILFDERFGLGGSFPSGEEVIFLMDCLRKNLKINNSLENVNENILQLKGTISKRLFPKSYMFVNIIIILRNYIRFYSKFPLIKITRSIFDGSNKIS